MNVQKRLSLIEHKLNDRRQDWKLDVLSALVLANSCLVGPGIVTVDLSLPNANYDTILLPCFPLPVLTVVSKESGLV